VLVRNLQHSPTWAGTGAELGKNENEKNPFIIFTL
jgi:hypothetical protein